MAVYYADGAPYGVVPRYGVDPRMDGQRPPSRLQDIMSNEPPSGEQRAPLSLGNMTLASSRGHRGKLQAAGRRRASSTGHMLIPASSYPILHHA